VAQYWFSYVICPTIYLTFTLSAGTGLGVSFFINFNAAFVELIVSLSSNTPITYTITDLSREFDITPRAIRFYEDQGLLSPKREGAGGRNRVYSARERTHLKLALRGKRLGLSLSDIKSIVDMYSSPKDTVPQLQRFLVVLARHRAALEQQQEDIMVLLEEIALHEVECHRLLTDPALPSPSVDSGE